MLLPLSESAVFGRCDWDGACEVLSARKMPDIALRTGRNEALGAAGRAKWSSADRLQAMEAIVCGRRVTKEAKADEDKMDKKVRMWQAK